MAIVVVGDVESDKIVEVIKKHFSSIKAPKVPLNDPELGSITTGRGIITKTHYEKPLKQVSVLKLLSHIHGSLMTLPKTSRI